MGLLKSLIPVLLIVLIFLTMKMPSIKKNLTSAIAIKARIVIGCTAGGILLGMAIIGGDVKEIIIVSLILILVIAGVVSLQNKYQYVKK